MNNSHDAWKEREALRAELTFARKHCEQAQARLAKAPPSWHDACRRDAEYWEARAATAAELLRRAEPTRRVRERDARW